MPSLYIVLAKPIPGVDAIGLEGRALSKYSDELDNLAKQNGVRPLMSFFSVNKDEALGMIDAEERDIDIPEETWFTADEGLATVSVLLRELSNSQSASTAAMARELVAFQRVLEAALSTNVRWHLAIDY